MPDDDDMGKIIEFPMHRVQRRQAEFNDDIYDGGIQDFNPEVMSDPQLGRTVLSCPPYVIGDIFDTIFWARRLSWMFKVVIAVEHPVIEEVSPEIVSATDVKFKDRSFDIMWFDEDKCISVFKIKIDKPLKKGELDKANKILKGKGLGNIPRRLISLFEPNPDFIEPEWTVIPLADFINPMYDISGIIAGNEDLSRSIANCSSFVYLVDEIITRFYESQANNNKETQVAMKYFAQQMGIYGIMCKSLKSGTGLF